MSEHLEMLSQHGDPLEILDRTIDFEYFRSWLVEGLGYGYGGAAETICGATASHQFINRDQGAAGQSQNSGEVLPEPGNAAVKQDWSEF